MASQLTIMLPELDPLMDPLADCISDPLIALGTLCGLDNLATDAQGYCCLMLDHHQVVHLGRRFGSARITLSVSLPGHAGSDPLAWANRMSAWCASGIRLKVLSDASLCAQLIFEGQGASGEALLATIDQLLAYADDWDDAVAVFSVASAVPSLSLPFSGVVQSGFSRSVKRRSRCA